MNAFETGASDHESPKYRLCPRCTRTVHAASNEHYCINDGSRMLEACPACDTQITSPYVRYCAACGFKMTGLGRTGLEMTGLEMMGLEMMGLEIVHQH
jgi:hypothetical protein